LRGVGVTLGVGVALGVGVGPVAVVVAARVGGRDGLGVAVADALGAGWRVGVAPVVGEAVELDPGLGDPTGVRDVAARAVCVAARAVALWAAPAVWMATLRRSRSASGR